MKKRFLAIFLVSFCAILISTSPGYAVLLNPDSTSLYDDNGASLFQNTGPMVSIELRDLLNPISEFGFYYESAPGTRIPLLGSKEKVASVDFFSGTVWHVTYNPTPTPPSVSITSFTPIYDNIGFYYGWPAPSFIGIIYSDPALNPSGIDLFYSFESKNPAMPNYHLMAFENPTAPGSWEGSLYVTITGGVKAVPEPSSVFLLGMGLLGVVVVRKRLLTGML